MLPPLKLILHLFRLKLATGTNSYEILKTLYLNIEDF